MYVCVCNGLRESDVREAAMRDGLTSAAELFDHKAVRPMCGKCVTQVHRMLRAGGAADQDAKPAAPLLRVAG